MTSHCRRLVTAFALCLAAWATAPVRAQVPPDEGGRLDITDAWVAGSDLVLFVEWHPDPAGPGGPGTLQIELADAAGEDLLSFAIPAASQMVTLPGAADPLPSDPPLENRVRELAVLGGPYGQYFAHYDLEIETSGAVLKKKPVKDKDKKRKKYCDLEIAYVECIVPEEDGNWFDDGDEIYVKMNGRTVWTLPGGDIDRNETASINFACRMCEKPGGATNFGLFELWDSDPPDDPLANVPFTSCVETGSVQVTEIRQGGWHYRLHWKITCYRQPVPGRGPC